MPRRPREEPREAADRRRQPGRHHRRRLARVPAVPLREVPASGRPASTARTSRSARRPAATTRTPRRGSTSPPLPPVPGHRHRGARGRREREPFTPLASPPVQPPVYTPLWLSIVASLGVVTAAGIVGFLISGKAQAMSNRQRHRLVPTDEAPLPAGLHPLAAALPRGHRRHAPGFSPPASLPALISASGMTAVASEAEAPSVGDAGLGWVAEEDQAGQLPRQAGLLRRPPPASRSGRWSST